MDKRTVDAWVPLIIAIAIPILTKLGNARPLLRASLAVAALHSRFVKPLFAVAMAILGAGVIASPMIVLWWRR